MRSFSFSRLIVLLAPCAPLAVANSRVADSLSKLPSYAASILCIMICFLQPSAQGSIIDGLKRHPEKYLVAVELILTDLLQTAEDDTADWHNHLDRQCKIF